MTDSQNPPLVGGADSDGPGVTYVLTVTYPDDGGRASESGYDRAAVVARRLRLEADRLDRLVPPADPIGTVRRSPEGLVAVKRGDWRHSWRGSDGYDHDHDDVAGWVRLVPAADVPDDAAELVAMRMLRIKLYGVALNERYDDLARRQWNKQLTDEERADWLNDARALLTDLGIAASDPQVPAGGDAS